MHGSPSKRIAWSLTQEALDKLLWRLDADRESAGQKYENIRRKLVKFFEYRGCGIPEDLADETINRVVRRIDDGEEIRASDPYLYFAGVARNVLREYWEKPEREWMTLEDLPPGKHPRQEPVASAGGESDQPLECMNRCIEKLPPQNRELIIRYYSEEKRAKIENRKEIAERLGIPLNALRIRVRRLREKLEACVLACLNRQAD